MPAIFPIDIFLSPDAYQGDLPPQDTLFLVQREYPAYHMETSTKELTTDLDVNRTGNK
jgi:hypothetical protein